MECDLKIKYRIFDGTAVGPGRWGSDKIYPRFTGVGSETCTASDCPLRDILANPFSTSDLKNQVSTADPKNAIGVDRDIQIREQTIKRICEGFRNKPR